MSAGKLERCNCGRLHARPSIELIVEKRGFAGIAERIARIGRPAHLVWDENSHAAAGRRLQRDLAGAGVHASSTMMGGGARLEADETAVGTLLCGLPRDRRLVLVSCGSGTLTDVTRMVACRAGLPFVSVATAPSMDGYASSVAPIVVAGIKTTFETQAPLAISANPAVLAAAPARMKAAGTGDLIGKLIARLDWLLSHHLTGEPFCPDIMAGVEGPLQAIIRRLESASGPARPLPFDARASLELFDGLCQSGLAMARMGNSRPASGAEHHLSHFFEMKHLDGRAGYFLHGETVALGTWLMAGLYRTVFAMSFDEFRRLSRRPAAGGEAARERLLGRAFGGVAPEMIKRWREGRPSPRQRAVLLGRLEEKWGELAGLAGAAGIEAARLERIFRAAGVPYRPEDFDFSPRAVRDAMIAAKEIRPRFTLLALLDSLGVLECCVGAAL